MECKQTRGKAAVCTCTFPQIRTYLANISGPLLYRIDIHIEVPRLSSEKLMSKRTGASSATVRRRVVKAREKQMCRMKGTGICCNSGIGSQAIQEFCEMDGSTKDLLKAAIAQFNLSGRGFVQRTWSGLEHIIVHSSSGLEKPYLNSQSALEESAVIDLAVLHPVDVNRVCWISGCSIEASAYEKIEWKRGFIREDIESWNLKF